MADTPSAWAMERAERVVWNLTVQWDKAQHTYVIARALDAAVAEEREACAKVAEAEKLTGERPPRFTDSDEMLAEAAVSVTARSIAAAIRSRP